MKGAPSLSFSYWVLMGRQGRHVHDACSARPTTWLTLRRDRRDARPGETPALGRARRNIHISLVVALVWKQGCEWWKLPHESNKMMWQTLIGWCEDGQIWLVKSVKVSECMCFWVSCALDFKWEGCVTLGNFKSLINAKSLQVHIRFTWKNKRIKRVLQALT